MKFIKNRVTLTALLSSVIGLFLIYHATTNIEPQQISISDIASDMEGRKVSIIGSLVEKRLHEDDHLFLTISDEGSEIQVVLFSDFMKNLEKLNITEKDFQIKGKISVKGIVEIYRGNLQIIPRNLDDVKILGE